MGEVLEKVWLLLTNCITAAAVLVIGRIVAKMVRGLIEKVMARGKQEQTLQKTPDS